MPAFPGPKECCKRTVVAEREAAFCGDCGAPIARCMAFEDCGGLVGRDGVCTECVRPILDIDASSVKTLDVGSVLTLPFKITNESKVERPLFVTSVWVKTGEEDRRKVDMLWERLDAGSTAQMPVRTSVLDQRGVHRIEVIFSVESRYRWRSETFLFAASVSVTVQSDQSSVVHQTINLQADKIEPGATVYAPVRSEQKPTSQDTAPIDLQLVHAERLELELGVRGYQNWRVPRDVRFRWRNFINGDAPLDGPINTRDGLLSFGRSRSKRQNGDGDVRLLAYDKSGINEDISVMISRRHFDVFVQNDRLMVRANSDAGMLVGEQMVKRGETAVIGPGSIVSPLERYRVPALKFELGRQHGLAEEVTVERMV